jgi:hypothetical protein
VPLLLTITPTCKQRADALRLGVWGERADFAQVGGVFSGTVDVAALAGDGSKAAGGSDIVTIDNVLGVVEDHYALW